MTIPINVYTIGAVVTLAAWVFALTRKSYGAFDFMPAIVGVATLIGTVSFWGAVVLAKFL